MTTSSIDEEAARWVVVLQDCDDESVWEAHAAWLEADPSHARAFELAERLWLEADALRSVMPAPEPLAVRTETDTVIDLESARAARTNRRSVLLWLPAAAAAALVGVIAVPRLTSPSGQDRQEIYETSPATTRVVRLADGSRVTLNRATSLSVGLGHELRVATLVSGEAAFDIRHDARRPFTVKAGGRDVRVLGTEFDVFDQNGDFGVTVRRGVVAVSNSEGAPATRLPAGMALRRDRQERRDRIGPVVADDAFSWTDGQLVYTDQPIAAVARDLARYGGTPVTLAPSLQAMRVTGVIEIGDGEAIDRQVERLLPVRVERVGDGKRIVRAR